MTDTAELTFTPTLIEDDEVADSNPLPEYSCEVCGKELTYGGRGRKPRFCEDHKAGKSKTSVKRASTVRHEAIAEQAAESLFTMNAFVQFLATMGGYENTADAIDIANPVFKERAIEALKSDPELAKSIARAGGPTARMALIMAYSMFAFAVVPVAYAEQRAKIADRKALESE